MDGGAVTIVICYVLQLPSAARWCYCWAFFLFDCGDQGSHCYRPEVLRSPHPGEWRQDTGHDHHPGAEREMEPSGGTERAEQLGDEDYEDTASSVESESDGDD